MLAAMCVCVCLCVCVCVIVRVHVYLFIYLCPNNYIVTLDLSICRKSYTQHNKIINNVILMH